MIEIRYAAESDKPFRYTLDRHLPERRWPVKVRDRQAYVLLEDGVPKGILRYNLFWDNTPCARCSTFLPMRRGGAVAACSWSIGKKT